MANCGRYGREALEQRASVSVNKLLADVAAVSAMLDRLLHHGHVLKCGPRSWRTKAAATE